MRVVRPVIQILMRAMIDRGDDLAPGGSIGAELVRDQSPRRGALLLQQTLQQAFGRFGIAPCLDDFVEDLAVLVDGSPEPVPLAGNGDHDLVQMPDVAAAWRPAPEAAGISRAEPQGPSSDVRIGHDDSALQQHRLDQPQT